MNLIKEKLRQSAVKELSLHNKSRRAQELKEIYKRLFQLEAWKKSETIAVTVSVGNELDTMPIIEQAWKQGKRIAVPRCIPSKKQLEFYYLEDVNQLEESYYGLLEPNTYKCRRSEIEEIELMIVPGLVFDRKGYRIGHGGGYYDRLLTAHSFQTVSICFDFQLVEGIFNENHDIPVDKIITPTEVVL